MSILSLRNLIKRYGSIIAVDNVSLDIRENEIFGLLGPNGAGKSTIIKIIGGLLKPDSGMVNIFSKNSIDNIMEIKRMLGIVPQELAIYENISARENVEFFGSLYGLRGKALREKVNTALEFVELNERLNDKPKNFSGGMKRRLNIACSIVHQPKIIIMDEPTVGIDTQSRNHILNSVTQLNKMGSTIIYTSHYIDEVESLCSCIGIIDNGKLIACGSKQELRKLVDTEETIFIETTGVTTDSVNEIKQLKNLLNVVVDQNNIAINTLDSHNSLQDILFILTKNGSKIRNLSIKEPNLESVFLSLTGKNLRD
jgi:ABC-2 type transport system ATP-binding protein